MINDIDDDIVITRNITSINNGDKQEINKIVNSNELKPVWRWVEQHRSNPRSLIILIVVVATLISSGLLSYLIREGVSLLFSIALTLAAPISLLDRKFISKLKIIYTEIQLKILNRNTSNNILSDVIINNKNNVNNNQQQQNNNNNMYNITFENIISMIEWMRDAMNYHPGASSSTSTSSTPSSSSPSSSPSPTSKSAHLHNYATLQYYTPLNLAAALLLISIFIKFIVNLMEWLTIVTMLIVLVPPFVLLILYWNIVQPHLQSVETVKQVIVKYSGILYREYILPHLSVSQFLIDLRLAGEKAKQMVPHTVTLLFYMAGVTFALYDFINITLFWNFPWWNTNLNREVKGYLKRKVSNTITAGSVLDNNLNDSLNTSSSSNNNNSGVNDSVNSSINTNNTSSMNLSYMDSSIPMPLRIYKFLSYWSILFVIPLLVYPWKGFVATTLYHLVSLVILATNPVGRTIMVVKLIYGSMAITEYLVFLMFPLVNGKSSLVISTLFIRLLYWLAEYPPLFILFLSHLYLAPSLINDQYLILNNNNQNNNNNSNSTSETPFKEIKENKPCPTYRLLGKTRVDPSNPLTIQFINNVHPDELVSLTFPRSLKLCLETVQCGSHFGIAMTTPQDDPFQTFQLSIISHGTPSDKPIVHYGSCVIIHYTGMNSRELSITNDSSHINQVIGINQNTNNNQNNQENIESPLTWKSDVKITKHQIIALCRIFNSDMKRTTMWIGGDKSMLNANKIVNATVLGSNCGIFVSRMLTVFGTSSAQINLAQLQDIIFSKESQRHLIMFLFSDTLSTLQWVWDDLVELPYINSHLSSILSLSKSIQTFIYGSKVKQE